jgi:hypothetical protein
MTVSASELGIETVTIWIANREYLGSCHPNSRVPSSRLPRVLISLPRVKFLERRLEPVKGVSA